MRLIMHLFFDLDGTLADSREGILRCFQQATRERDVRTMNGLLAQIVALACHANAAFRDGTAPGFFPQHGWGQIGVRPGSDPT